MKWNLLAIKLSVFLFVIRDENCYFSESCSAIYYQIICFISLILILRVLAFRCSSHADYWTRY